MFPIYGNPDILMCTIYICTRCGSGPKINFSFSFMYSFKGWLHLYHIATRCLRACVFVCVFVAYLLRNGWTDLAKKNLLAPSRSRGGFRLKNSGSGIRFFRKSGKTDFGKL